MKLTKITTVLSYVAVVMTMSVATVVEKLNGRTDIYSSWWFVAIWAVLAVSSVAYVLRQKLYDRPIAFTLHVALVLILVGALTSYLWGEQSAVHLRVGLDNHQLPFTVRLDSFIVENYPGTQSPMDFISHISFVENNGEVSSEIVSMNNIVEHSGYRFYQSAYDYDGEGSILAVSHDPWGIGITYVGYFLLFIAMALMLVLPNEGFRKTLRAVSKMSMIFALLLTASDVSAEPKSLPKDVAAEMCDVYVYYNDRVCPLQTVAKDFTKKLCGKSSYNGMSSEQVFTGWFFFPSTWTSEPMIKVKSGDKKYISYDELSGRMNSAVDDEKVNVIRMLLGGQMMSIYPYDNNGELIWLSQGDNLPLDMPDDQWFFIKKSLDYMGELAVMKDYGKFTEAVGKIRNYQVKYASDTLPNPCRTLAERIYNRLDYNRPLSMAMATVGIVAFVFIIIRWVKVREIPKAVGYALLFFVSCMICYLAVVITLRGYVGNHLPITNGFETMQFMSFTALVLTIVMRRKFVLIYPFGILLAGLTLMVSMFGEANPQITNLMPVLASPLLSIHVCVIMVAYSLLAFMMFNGITALIVETVGKQEQSHMLYNVSRLLLYPALFLLTAGIFIGAIWANQSWGRYWGWDPKEVWALITMMVYAVPLHKSLVPVLSKPRAFHIFSIVAFLTVLMTYFGVNFLLGGMHSYANS